MSRLIVKNLPKKIKEERVRSIFGAVGTLTDCSLKFTKDGVFRNFAFIGYSSEAEADQAVKQLNKTFIDASRISVEKAKDFSDVNKPRAWSKYSSDSSAFQKKHKDTDVKQNDNAKNNEKKEKKKKSREKVVAEMLGELKDDPKFEEFVQAHQRSGNKSLWANDEVMPKGETLEESDKMEEQERKGTENDEEGNEKGDDIDEELEEEEDVKDKDKLATKKNVTDLDYLKSKVSSQAIFDDSSSDSEEDETETKTSRKTKLRDKQVEPNKAEEKYMLKMRNLPVSSGEKAIKEFFKPINIKDIRLPQNNQKKPIGVAYVDFSSEKDLNDAMRRNKNYIKSKRVYLKKCEKGDVTQLKDEEKEKQNNDTQSANKKRWEEHEAQMDSVAETGRLFVRNLPYSCTQEDLEELFGKFGPLAEVHLSIDTVTKKIRGYAFILFMMPEHAVRAYEQLDGSVFKGRMLHIIPGKEKLDDDTEHSEGSSFKTKKAAKQKAEATSSHNWNTLFLGVNAVADVMAAKYNTEKSHILDPEAPQSLGVRMALGETQIVAETRDFLTENGVVLDSFSQAAAPRSKTVILVKNLPANTDPEDLRTVFSKHGALGRVILPPSGITAIVEYLDPTEAKLGFRNLAYTKFQHVPLYLEWAPMEVFRSPVVKSEEKETSKDSEMYKKEENEEESSSEDDESGIPEPDSTLFVKNLNFTTTEEGLREKFKKCGKIRSVSIAKKKDMKNPGKYLSMGYGFVEFQNKESSMKAIKELQHTDLDGHAVELKISNRTTLTKEKPNTKKKQKVKKQKTTKILVRNIPFEAKKPEIYELFKVFGELKFVRLPKKLGGTGSHRGFGFVDFLTRQDAKRAFDALCHSTHLYGRRLVLEWAESAEDLDQLRKKTAEHFHEDGPSKKLKKSAILDNLQSSNLEF
ncbi:probable RNA-binding protein 19 isoform X2 [Saccostrea echinata]|uniref:probable RNA-binding protein 19 isoform X2 n=1 Tax=Saccostrea echinata TaxID=191078 RepID=UPI002A7F1DF1|nr:probable RNA-binding protein 19 isoform X2 [Saccostrea echinata]